MNMNKALFTFIKIAFSIMVVLLVVYGAVRLCRVGYDYGYRLFTEPAMEEEPGEDVLVQVKADMSGRDIADMLKEKGLIRDSSLFYIQLKLSSLEDKIKPGVYTLNTSMEPKALMTGMIPPDEPEETQEPEEAAEETGGTEDASEGSDKE